MNPLFIAAVNFVACSALGWACLCRIAVMDHTTRRVWRAKYCVALTAATASGWGPLFDQWPTWVHVGLAVAFLFVLAGGARAWRWGVPDYARKVMT